MRTISLLALGIALIAIALNVCPAVAQDSSIVGSYELLSRDLKRGKKIDAPKDVAGMLTFTANRRNFNVMWKRDDGSTASISYVGKYKLTNDQYCEEPVFWMQNNMDGLGVVKYGAPLAKNECSTVMRDGQTIVFSFKGEPVIAMFERGHITATATDQKGDVIFVDHWRRVD